MTLGERRSEANRLIAYHAPIALRLTLERTGYDSQLIPVTPYILVACVEAFLRYPALMAQIDRARPAEDIALAGHHPGVRINSVFLWSIANFFLLGRKALTAMDPTLDDPDAAFTVLDFWERAALAYRHHDGTRQAADSDGVVRPYGSPVIDPLLEGQSPVTSDEQRSRYRKLNATLVNYLFLMHFDTRVGVSDTGPYELPDGRVLLVRDFYRLGPSDFWWSDVAVDVPYRHLVAGLVLDGVELRITDFSTATTTPEDYLDHLVGFSLFTTDPAPGRSSPTPSSAWVPPGPLRPVPDGEIDDLVTVVRAANRQHYRNVAAMSRAEMIRCGAYVYFSFLRPFAEVAGVDADIDWRVPQATPPPVVELLSAFDNDTAGDIDPDAPWYDVFA